MTSSDPPKVRRGTIREQQEGDEPTLRGIESSSELNTGIVIVILPSADDLDDDQEPKGR